MSVSAVVIKDERAKVSVVDFETGKKKTLKYKVVRPAICDDALEDCPGFEAFISDHQFGGKSIISKS